MKERSHQMLLRNHFFLTSSPALMKSYSMLKPRAVSPLPLNRSVRCGPDDTSTGGRNTLPLNTARRVLFVSWICEEEEREKAADWRWKRIQGWGETGTRTDRQRRIAGKQGEIAQTYRQTRTQAHAQASRQPTGQARSAKRTSTKLQGESWKSRKVTLTRARGSLATSSYSIQWSFGYSSGKKGDLM